jgi:hypothetical protein
VDEVPTLQELHLVSGGAGAASEQSQTTRLPRLVPIWYWCQTQVMAFLPLNETTARLFPAICGFIFVLVSFTWAWRSQGQTFAICLALMILASPLFLALTQQNRFYTMALLFQCLAQMTILDRTSRFRAGLLVLTVLLTLAAILCHNVLLIYFTLASGVAVVAYAFGWVNRNVLIRSLAAGAASVCLYLFYLRPVIQGWNEIHAHRTVLQVALSLLSEAGIPMLLLAFLGGALSLRKEDRSTFGYWAMLGATSMAFVFAAPLIIWFFNYRYALLFLFPVWVLAARATWSIGQILADSRLTWVWYGCVAVLLLPKVMSYYQDGSRWDLRSAAKVVSEMAGEESPTVYSNFADILNYYMPAASVKEWPAKEVADRSCFVVWVTNAWDEPVRAEGRVVELLATVGRRRFDEQSYLVRVYRIRPTTSVAHLSPQPQTEKTAQRDP